MSDLRMERRFPASPETVFEYLTKPAYILQWWCPEGLIVSDHNLDLSRLGRWHSVMTNAEGANYKVSGEVVVHEPPHCVEFSWAWHDEQDQRGQESHVRFEVSPDGPDGALFTMTHSGLPDEESLTNHEEGWQSTFVKLERLLG